MTMAAAVMMMALQAADWPWRAPDYPSDAHYVHAEQPLVVDERWSGRPVRVRLTQAYIQRCMATATWKWLNGLVTDHQERCLHLARLEVLVAGKPLRIAPKAYTDLGDIFDVAVRSTSTQLVVSIRPFRPGLVRGGASDRQGWHCPSSPRFPR